jgi:hypothetical protein
MLCPAACVFELSRSLVHTVACHANVLGFGGSAMPGLDTIDLCALRIASDAARKALDAVG